MDTQVRQRSFCDGAWRLTLWDGLPIGELYDLRNDPGEIRNLWADPAHAADKARLCERMLWKMIDLQDRSPFQVGEA